MWRLRCSPRVSPSADSILTPCCCSYPVPLPDGSMAYMTEQELLANQQAYEAWVREEERRRGNRKALAVGATAAALCLCCTIQ